jgi:hypothetical protein
VTQQTEPSSCAKGDMAEMLFAAGAIIRDWEIYMPFGHAQTTDVCLLKPFTTPIKVQVKTAWWDAAYESYAVFSRKGSQAYKDGDFDVLAAYLPDINQFVFWSFPDISGRQKIRYSPERHRKPSNWELLDDVAKSLARPNS